jgi:hypothetical protein
MYIGAGLNCNNDMINERAINDLKASRIEIKPGCTSAPQFALNQDYKIEGTLQQASIEVRQGDATATHR